MKRSTKRGLLAIGIAGPTVVIIALIVAFEPLADRFEGRTVRQWVRHFAEQPAAQVEWQKIFELRGTNALVEPRVISAFRTNALKPLIAEVQDSSFLDGLVLELGLRLNRPILLHYEKDARRDAVARLWATEWAWAAENSNDVVYLLKHGSDEEFLCSVFELFSDPLTGAPVLHDYTNHPDVTVRERAKFLRKRLHGE